MSRVVSPNTVLKWRKLTDLLIQLTREDRIVWKISAEEDEYLTSVADSVVTIAKRELSKEGESVPVVVVTVLNRSGEVVDTFNDEDIDGGSDGYFLILTDLMADIARKISGADEILDSIISGLELKLEIPF